MTESDWLTATVPYGMLAFLRDSGKLTDRKARLFAAACCRRIWHLITLEIVRAAVGVAERYADGEVGYAELSLATAAAEAAITPKVNDPASYLMLLAWQSVGSATSPVVGHRTAVETSAWACQSAIDTAQSDQVGRLEQEAHGRLLRDLFGNPFRPLPPLSPAVLSWENGLVVRLAEAAYEHRLLPSGHLDNARLAVLADALEDAGCTDAVLLGHLRLEGPHVRGCIAVDAVLGRP